MDMIDPPLTTSVPEYGAIVFELPKNGSYEAANAGVFSTIKVKGKKRVPWRAELRKLAGGDADTLEKLTRDFLSRWAALRAAQDAA